MTKRPKKNWYIIYKCSDPMPNITSDKNNKRTHKPTISPRGLSILSLVLSLQGLGGLAALLFIPTDPANTAFLGYSTGRLAMASVLLFGSAALMANALLVSQNKSYYKAVNGILTDSRLFLLLLAGSLVGVALSVDWPFAAPELYATYMRAFPLLLFVTLVCTQLLVFHLLPQGKERQRKLALVAMVGILIFSYLSATAHYSQVNREYWLSDQGPMLNFVRLAKNSNYTYSGTRDFMPAFPFLASPFMDITLEDPQFFAQGKMVNIVISLVFLAFIFLLVRRYFDLAASALFVFIAAFTLFIYRAPYFQPELTYYFFSFLAFILILELFLRQNFFTAVGAGLLMALAHFTKASVLPLIALFCVAMIAQALYAGLVKNQGWHVAARHLAILAITLLAFLLPMAPYLIESKETYGSYFYNVNSTYYLWFDSWGEAKTSNQTLHYALGTPDVPKSELPSLQNYLRTHDLGEILDRFGKGFANQTSNWVNTYAVASFPVLFLSALGMLIVQRRQRAWALVKEHPILTLFLIFFFVGYTTLFAWYGPITDYADRRFTYGLYLPLLLSIFLAMQALAENDKHRSRAPQINWLPLFYGSAAVLLAADLLLRVPYQFLNFHWFSK